MKQTLKLIILVIISTLFFCCHDDSPSYGYGGGYSNHNSNSNNNNTIKPQVDFKYSTEASLTVRFTNNSINATSYEWDFGDGTKSYLTHPSHTYTSMGTKHVTLTAYNTAYNGTTKASAYTNINLYSHIRMTNISSNPYRIYIDGENQGSLSGGYYQDFKVSPGNHRVRILQISGYLLYPTDESYTISCVAEKIVVKKFPETLLKNEE
ncbi:MAG: PKD domain-containing protein [Bacteroidales bacterium]|nr:PKD domain-containing protein [Bacteroidales bacterium]